MKINSFLIPLAARWAKICVGLTLLGGAGPAIGFDISYHYELTEGKKLDVCRHMLKTYNKLFRIPWSDRWAPRERGRFGVLAETLYAVHPSSPEFDAIRWRTHTYTTHGIEHTALYAEVDVDNDGVKDLVIHKGFFTGSPGSRDYLYVFPLGSVDLGSFRTQTDFLERVSPKRTAVLGYPVHERLFVFKGRTYVHGYVFTPRTFPGADPSEPFGRPEYLLIREYLGGPATDGGVQARVKSMRTVCTFNMAQQAH